MKNNIKFLFFTFILLNTCVNGYAQKNKKPQLVVYGSDVEALAAAVQSAKSNVPTLWLIDQMQWLPELPNEAFTVEGNTHLDGGIWMEILMKIGNSKTFSDSVAHIVKKRINPQLLRNAVDEMLTAHENLTIFKNVKIQQINRKRKGWEVQLADKRKYEVRNVVDASLEQDLMKMQNSEGENDSKPVMLATKDLDLNQFRLIVGSASIAGKTHSILFDNMVQGEKEGLFGLGALEGIKRIPDNLPIRFAYGQALGAVGAYCAFFKTTHEKIDIRLLQSELLTYGARLIPFQDIAAEDPNFQAIQKFSLAGLLLGYDDNGKYMLDRERIVRQEEVQLVLNQMHSRSKLWFLDHSADEFTWSNLLGFIKFVSFRGDELETMVKKEFNSYLHFSGEYDPEGIMTRYEFGVMLDTFASPYNIKINQKGEIIR